MVLVESDIYDDNCFSYIRNYIRNNKFSRQIKGLLRFELL